MLLLSIPVKINFKTHIALFLTPPIILKLQKERTNKCKTEMEVRVMKSIERIIVTNNPTSAKAYGKSDRIMFMQDATPYEVYMRVRDLLENGGRLSKPVIRDKTSYYTTVSVFYSDTFEPSLGNLREIDAACRATKGVQDYNPKMKHIRQVIDLRRNGPDYRPAA